MKTKQNGFVMATLLGVIIIMSILIVSVTSGAISNYQSATGANARMNAQFVADAGLDVGLHELNKDSDYAGSGGEIQLLSSVETRTTYEVSVSPGSTADRKIVRSTGRTYTPGSSTTPKAIRIFELEAEAVTSGTGPGAVVSGVGGLTLLNNAKVTGGDVIVNGVVDVSNNAQIGLSTNPVNLRVAHQACPVVPDATYPVVCVLGEPIVNNGLIYADVQAQNQTTSAGMSSPGLTSSSFAPVVVPGHDRVSQKAASSPVGGYSPNSAPIKCVGGVATWPANVKVAGDVTIPNNCIVTIEGDIWITGSLSFGNNAEIVIDDGLLTTRPFMMIDGEDGFITGNNTVITPNASGTGAEVVTMWWNTNLLTNGGFDCGGIADPLDCAAVVGLALSTSQSVTTIELSNNADANNTVFRSIWSGVEVSNNGSLGAVAGQTIRLNENAVINFSASIAGSDNLITTWVKRGYLRVFQ